ncbi:MAG: riboflavin synthase [Planctomycetota bacterium]
MFTGLVQAIGTVAASETTPRGLRLDIDPGSWDDHRAAPGDSICISGTCLTVVDDPSLHHGRLLFDAIPETLAKTTLGELVPGSRVNLERSVTADTLMGGHMVQGHVDAIGEVTAVLTEGQWRTTVLVPEAFTPFLVPKGSINVDGVSLTIASAEPQGRTFDVALIPETLERTTLADARPGTRVNLESDIIARTVVHYMQHFAKNAPTPTTA